jgi:5-methylcytosine-specific restriction endonuclease McrA
VRGRQTRLDHRARRGHDGRTLSRSRAATCASTHHNIGVGSFTFLAARRRWATRVTAGLGLGAQTDRGLRNHVRPAVTHTEHRRRGSLSRVAASPPRRELDVSTYGRREGRLTPRERREILERDGHVCQLQLSGCSFVATVVDHVVNLAAGGDRDDLANRQAVCASCHAVKTEAEKRAGIQASAARRRGRLKLPSAPHPGEMR